MKYQFDGEAFLMKVRDCDIMNLEIDEVTMFEKTLPKGQEYQKMREAVIGEQYAGVEDALKRGALFGRVEGFIARMMCESAIDTKVEVIKAILKFFQGSLEYQHVSSATTDSQIHR